MSIYNRRCNEIKKELCKHNIKADVHRKTLFDEKYYAIDVEDSFCEDIAKALNIPFDWVEMAVSKENFERYLVLEKELNDKYCDCNGELVFAEPYKLSEHLDDIYSVSERLKEVGFEYDGIFRDRWNGLDVLFIKVPYTSGKYQMKLRDALGIVSTSQIGMLRDKEMNGSGWLYINLEQLK